MKQTAGVECLILSDELSTTEIFCKNILKIEGNNFELIDAKNSIKYELVIQKEFNLEKFYHSVLFVFNLNNNQSLEKIISKVSSISEMTSKHNFDFILLLIANSYNKIDNNIEKAKRFATNSSLFYIEIDFTKTQNTDIITRILRVRLNQSFSHHTEYYITNINQQLMRIFDNESIDKEATMTVSSFESKIPPQLPDREEDRAFFSFDENPFSEEVSNNMKIVKDVILLLKLKVTFNKKTLVIPVNSNDDGMSVGLKIKNMFNLKFKIQEEHELACFLTKKLNKLIDLLISSSEKHWIDSTNIINLNNILGQPKKKPKDRFKTIFSYNNEKLIFFTKNTEDVDFIVDEINSYLKLSNRSVIYEIVKSSFDPQKLNKKISIDTQNLKKQLNKALFCVNIEIGNNKTGKILVKINDDLEIKTNEFISSYNLERDKVYKKIINLLKRLYKETINKKF